MPDSPVEYLRNGNLESIQRLFPTTFIFNRWIRNDLRISILQAICKNFDFSFQNITFPVLGTPEIYRKFPVILSEFYRNFPENFRKFPTLPSNPQPTPPYPYPTSFTPISLIPSELQIHFSQKNENCAHARFFPRTFMYVMYL